MIHWIATREIRDISWVKMGHALLDNNLKIHLLELLILTNFTPSSVFSLLTMLSSLIYCHYFFVSKITFSRILWVVFENLMVYVCGFVCSDSLYPDDQSNIIEGPITNTNSINFTGKWTDSHVVVVQKK